MKKTFRFLMVALMGVAMTALFSCDKDESTTPTGGNGGNGGNGGGIPAGFVDLDLPSGVLWAECNVTANSPEDIGGYFAWGETNPKDTFYTGNYFYSSAQNNYPYSYLTKYCNNPNYGYNLFTDSLATLEPGDDAATTHLGSSCRTPSIEEWRELMAYTRREWTNLNGVPGLRLTARNGNSIFLPSNGFFDGALRDKTQRLSYWSSTLSSNQIEACMFVFNAWIDDLRTATGWRWAGCCVRAVRNGSGGYTPAIIPAGEYWYENRETNESARLVVTSGYSNTMQYSVATSLTDIHLYNGNYTYDLNSCTGSVEFVEQGNSSNTGTGTFSYNAENRSITMTLFDLTFTMTATFK